MFKTYWYIPVVAGIFIFSAIMFLRQSYDDDSQSPAERAETLFVQHDCATCHVQQAPLRAPLLKQICGKTGMRPNHTQQIIDQEYLRKSVRNPGEFIVPGYQNIMPPYSPTQLSDEQLNLLVQYIFGCASSGR